MKGLEPSGALGVRDMFPALMVFFGNVPEELRDVDTDGTDGTLCGSHPAPESPLEHPTKNKKLRFCFTRGRSRRSDPRPALCSPPPPPPLSTAASDGCEQPEFIWDTPVLTNPRLPLLRRETDECCWKPLRVCEFESVLAVIACYWVSLLFLFLFLPPSSSSSAHPSHTYCLV
ncbi:uncharacterized protein V6R79_001332 [Siganus canaliculatus]